MWSSSLALVRLTMAMATRRELGAFVVACVACVFSGSIARGSGRGLDPLEGVGPELALQIAVSGRVCDVKTLEESMRLAVYDNNMCIYDAADDDISVKVSNGGERCGSVVLVVRAEIGSISERRGQCMRVMLWSVETVVEEPRGVRLCRALRLAVENVTRLAVESIYESNWIGGDRPCKAR